jgi:hypothetical protein
VSFLATLNTRRVVRGRGTDHEQNSISRRPTTLAPSVAPEVETNMFHLGTRMPSIHEVDYPEYPDFDMVKPGYAAEPTRCVCCFHRILCNAQLMRIRLPRNYSFAM